MRNNRKLSSHVREFLRSLHSLFGEQEEVSITDIASHLGIDASSVLERVKPLKRNGFVEHEPSGVISLTEKGKEKAEKITLTLANIRRFLEVLGVEHTHAETDAHKIEQVTSQETMRRLSEFLRCVESKIGEAKISDLCDSLVKNGRTSEFKRRWEPIGIIHTPYKVDKATPHQAYKSEDTGRVEVFKKYEEGLKDIEGFSHIILLYEFNRSIKRSIKKDYRLESYGLTVKPFLDEETHGLFATRAPNRPNPIGLSVVKLLKRKKNVLRVKGVDMLDGTPLLDIKPNVPAFDRREKTKIGWLEGEL